MVWQRVLEKLAGTRLSLFTASVIYAAAVYYCLAEDGIASFGIIGIAVSFAVLSIFLITVDRVARGAPREFSVLIALPIGLTLTNVSLFTVLLSFGGLFWLVTMPAAFPSAGKARLLT